MNKRVFAFRRGSRWFEKSGISSIIGGIDERDLSVDDLADVILRRVGGLRDVEHEVTKKEWYNAELGLDDFKEMVWRVVTKREWYLSVIVWHADVDMDDREAMRR
ncbi:hypothetical protein Scep_016919 [Stephania cephalantha]|uniref:Uncharacterized protein n=1 Tax=Stephania cephalantha TaxID=152367 RepID=A0AAP0NWE5_9MAGN